MTHPDGTHIDFAYNNYLGASTMTDEDGYVWSYEYVNRGMVSAIIDPLNHIRHYFYSGANELTSFWDPLYNPTSNPTRYKAYTWVNHKNTQIKDNTGAVKTFSYHPTTGDMVSVKDDNLHTTSAVRDSTRRITGRTDRRGKITTYTYDPATGLLKTVTNRNGKVTTLSYDAHGNTTSVVDAAGKTWSLTYDAAGRRLTVTDPLLHTTTTSYDVANRVTRTTRHNTSRYDYTYDGNGNLLTAADPLGHATTYTYDDRDRRVSEKDALLNTTTFGYSNRNLLTSVTDPLGRATGYEYDAARRQTSTIQPAPAAGGTPVVTQYTYNNADELIALTDAKGQTTSFAWNPAAKTSTKTFPDASTEVSVLDGVGNLVSYTNRSGTVAAKTYDANNRLTVQNCTTCGATFAYDDEGNLAGVVDANAGTYSWAYDNLGRVLTSVQPGGTSGGAKTVGYTYDDAGRQLSLTYPDGMLLAYGYDTINRLTSIAKGGSVYSFAYDAADRRTSQAFPADAYYNSYANFTYDNANRMTGSAWYWYTNLYSSHSYTFDAANEITSTTASNGLSGTRSYTYDNLGRLFTRTPTGSLNAPYPALMWNLDPVGNRTSTTGPATVNYSLKPNGLNQYNMVAGNTFSYDTRGNLTSDGARTMGYDADNRLAEVATGSATVNYTYDFAHRLAQRSVSGTGGSNARYIYDQNWNVLADIDAASGNTIAKYIHGPKVDEILAQVGASASYTYYFFQDHLGSTVAAVRASDNSVAQRYTYDEYGSVQVRDNAGAPSSAALLTRYTYTGREYDVAVGIYHYRHRWYSPAIGRWMSSDPIGERGGINLYGYVGENPTSRTDSSGLDYGEAGTLYPPYNNQKMDPNRTCWATLYGAGAGGLGTKTPGVGGAFWPAVLWGAISGAVADIIDQTFVHPSYNSCMSGTANPFVDPSPTGPAPSPASNPVSR